MKQLPNEEIIDFQVYDERYSEYEAPAIIYDGVIRTRAGSPAGFQRGTGQRGVDPADLFGK